MRDIFKLIWKKGKILNTVRYKFAELIEIVTLKL